MLASNGFDDLRFVLACFWCKFLCEKPSYVPCFVLLLKGKD